MQEESEQLVTKAFELLKHDDGNLYEHEMLIILPAINQAVAQIEGIQILVDGSNFIGAVSLLRSLLETTMVFVYECTAERKEDHYKQFLENDRLMRWSKSDKKWVQVKDFHLIANFESQTGWEIESLYNSCCEIIHFSTRHMNLITTPDESEEGFVEISLGFPHKDVRQRYYQEIIDSSKICQAWIMRYLRALIERKAAKDNAKKDEN
ncbi:MAG TPA: DUF5677 domain-containing protein [Acidimicrobiia bacterium]|nr:DUF5677 domain-containing protein [Acidimicrobiia bacterium]